MAPRTMTLLAVLALAQLPVAIPAVLAQTVEAPNALIVYFDQEAASRAWSGTGPVTAYITAGPLSFWDGQREQPAQALERWFGQLSFEPAGHVASVVVTPRGQATPASVVLPYGWANLDFALQPGLPLSGRTVVAEIALVVTSPEPTLICLWGGEFRADGWTGQFAMLTFGPDGPMDMTCLVAGINMAAPVADSRGTWGTVKELYR